MEKRNSKLKEFLSLQRWGFYPTFIQTIIGYYFVKKSFNNLYVPSIACLLLVLDPLFIDASSTTLFDLGQTLTMLLYLVSVLYFKNNAVIL